MNTATTSPLNAQLWECLWKDTQAEASFPTRRPLVAHYTSVATFEKIVNNNEIWFSNPLYMNDWEELRFGMNEGADQFRASDAIRQACGDAETHSKLLAEFDRLFTEFDRHHVLDTYVVCCSEHSPDDNDGLLSMWRGYGAGGVGVAIVFDLAKLQAREWSPLVVGKVRYEGSAERLAWIDAKISALSDALRQHSPLDDAQLAQIAHAWIERLKEFAIFTKHSGFREEKEWRIVYFSERDKERVLAPMFNYAITARGVEPKLKLKVAPLAGVIDEQTTLTHIVDRVILGPSISTVLASNSVRRMLELSPNAALASRVRESSIPYRP